MILIRCEKHFIIVITVASLYTIYTMFMPRENSYGCVHLYPCRPCSVSLASHIRTNVLYVIVT